MTESDFNERDFDDSKLSRCFGLSKKIAKKVSDNSSVYAGNVYKEHGPFYCPVCLSEAIVRKCTEMEDHFAHKARLSPTIKSKDQKLHNFCRDFLTEKLKKNFPDGRWLAERIIEENKEKDLKEIKPDISGIINKKPIAIEIQLSPYTVNKIFKKLEEYKKRKIYVLYIVPLFEDLGEKAFRPRLYEKYLHSIYYGKVYYWSAKNPDIIFPVHFSPEKRYIPMTTWFDLDIKEERSSGGFTLAYKTLRKPSYGKPLEITKDFFVSERKYFKSKSEKKDIPECLIYKDNLPKWWDKDEYDKIFQEQKNIDKNDDILNNYDFYDDYDDYDEEL